MTNLPPPPTGTPPVGWHNNGGLRYFDGRSWQPPLEESVASGSMPSASGGLREASLALAVLLLSLLAGGVGFAVAEELGLPEWMGIAILTLVGYGPPLVWALRRLGRRVGGGVASGRSLIGRPRPADVAKGALVWVSAVVAQAMVAAALLGLGVEIGSNTEGLFDDSGLTAALLVTAFAAVVAAPVVEEVVFRGVILPALVPRVGRVFAVVVQAVVFGAVHADPSGSAGAGLVVVLAAVGAVFGVAALITGRLWPVILGHALFNGVVLAVVLIAGPDVLGG
ncbi:MAG: CPBP family glutamic-type intramembrane protease [Actinomycetota bacterium]|nr:CPBP family glutamic-type intramembrane protease [Actinomycetota bacterium]